MTVTLLVGPKPVPHVDGIDWAATITAIVALMILAGMVGGAVLLIQAANKRSQKAAQEAAQRAAEQRLARWNALVAAFGEAAAARIARGEIWKGQTLAMLIEARGSAASVSKDVMKTKTKLTLKYGQIARNRYALQVSVEDDVVVGWKDAG